MRCDDIARALSTILLLIVAGITLGVEARFIMLIVMVTIPYYTFYVVGREEAKEDHDTQG